MNISKIGVFQPSFGIVDKNAAYHAIADIKDDKDLDLSQKIEKLLLVEEDIKNQKKNRNYRVVVHSPYSKGYAILFIDNKVVCSYKNFHEACNIANVLDRKDKARQLMVQNQAPCEAVEKEILDLFA